MGKLENKRVLITGSGSNVGRALCELFAREGAQIVAADLDYERAQQSAKLALGRVVRVVQSNLTIPVDCDHMVAETLKALGGIDVLCNTAGIDLPKAKKVHETSETDWDRILDVNLKGVFLSCRAVIPGMVAQGYGAIVNVASQGALLTMPDMAAYGVSKAAVLQLTRQIAADYASNGIRANCVCPSGLQAPSLDRLSILASEQLDRRTETMRHASPLGRICTPNDVALAMLFLASSMADYITGVALPVEGGATIAMKF